MLSIFLCTYNRPALLAKCLDSIGAQTDPRWELLIADDNSSDPHTQRLCREFKASRPGNNVFYWNTFVQEEVRKDVVRFSYNFNSLAKLAKGQYFMFLTDDSELYPMAVRAVHTFFETTGANAGYMGQEIIEVDAKTGELTNPNKSMRNNAAYGKPLTKAFCVVDLSQVAHKREFFKDWPTEPQHWHHADGMAFDDLIERAGPLEPIGNVLYEPLVIYKIQDTSVSRQPIEQALRKLQENI